MRPADYPPPWNDGEAIAAPSDAEPIEVGVLVVGAGPAGLAAAIRLGQLAAADPETAAELGEVPVAVLEKGKAPGLAPALGRGARTPARCAGCSAATTSRRTARCPARRSTS